MPEPKIGQPVPSVPSYDAPQAPPATPQPSADVQSGTTPAWKNVADQAKMQRAGDAALTAGSPEYWTEKLGLPTKGNGIWFAMALASVSRALAEAKAYELVAGVEELHNRVKYSWKDRDYSPEQQKALKQTFAREEKAFLAEHGPRAYAVVLAGAQEADAAGESQTVVRLLEGLELLRGVCGKSNAQVNQDKSRFGRAASAAFGESVRSLEKNSQMGYVVDRISSDARNLEARVKKTIEDGGERDRLLDAIEAGRKAAYARAAISALESAKKDLGPISDDDAQRAGSREAASAMGKLFATFSLAKAQRAARKAGIAGHLGFGGDDTYKEMLHSVRAGIGVLLPVTTMVERMVYLLTSPWRLLMS